MSNGPDTRKNPVRIPREAYAERGLYARTCRWQPLRIKGHETFLHACWKVPEIAEEGALGVQDTERLEKIEDPRKLNGD